MHSTGASTSLLRELHADVCHQERALEVPKESEMPARDKYTVFSRTSRNYRKPIQFVPKWTRVRALYLLPHYFSLT